MRDKAREKGRRDYSAQNNEPNIFLILFMLNARRHFGATKSAGKIGNCRFYLTQQDKIKIG
ncbi:MAG: hypothetical protein ABFC98_03210 [Candidatus Cloacimonas sp.]